MTASWLAAATQTKVREPNILSLDFMLDALSATMLPVYQGLGPAHSTLHCTLRGLVGTRGSIHNTVKWQQYICSTTNKQTNKQTNKLFLLSSTLLLTLDGSVSQLRSATTLELFQHWPRDTTSLMRHTTREYWYFPNPVKKFFKPYTLNFSNQKNRFYTWKHQYILSHNRPLKSSDVTSCIMEHCLGYWNNSGWMSKWKKKISPVRDWRSTSLECIGIGGGGAGEAIIWDRHLQVCHFACSSVYCSLYFINFLFDSVW